MKDWRKTLIVQTAPVLEAMRLLDSTGSQICLVVDGEDRLQGTLTDGDIRRGILKGVPLSDPVTAVMNHHPLTTSEGNDQTVALATMRRQSLRHMPVVDAERRVVAMLTADEMARPAQRPNWVVLMAGGEGQRLRPLTNDRPKPLIRVGTKPILETIVEIFIDHGFSNFFIAVNYKAEQIEAHFGDGCDHGGRIVYLREDRKLGTAGPLGLLPEHPSDPFFVMNGDILTKVDYLKVLDFHRQSGSVATMCVREYTFQVPYGVVEVDGHRLVRIDEKPEHRNFVNAGIYVFNPEVLAYIPRDRAFTMPDLFEALMADGLGCTVFPITEYWMDVGRLEDLDRARADYVEFFG